MIASDNGTVMVQLKDVKLDGGTQLRESINPEVLETYTEAMAAGVKFPPCVAFFDGAEYWLADGFQRVVSAKRNGIEALPFIIKPGSVRDAILYAAGANATHGAPRTAADKRKAVRAVLADPNWATKTDGWIATVCAVRHDMVKAIRIEFAERQTETDQPATRTGRDGKQYPVARKKKPPATPPLARKHPDDEDEGDGEGPEAWEKGTTPATPDGDTDVEGDDGSVIDLDAPATSGREPGDDTEAERAVAAKRRANGKEKVTARERTEALEAWGVINRYLDKLGVHDRLRPHLVAITAELEGPAR